MSLYSRARRHIDMNRVKKLHEEKVEQKKLIEKEKESIREELKNFNSPEFSNWRFELEEGMTSSGMFQTTLPATGDVDLIDISTSDSGQWPFRTGVNLSQSGISFNGEPYPSKNTLNWSLSSSTDEIDASTVSDIKITVSAGTGIDSPKISEPLNVYWVTNSDLGLLGSFSGSGTKIFRIPSEAMVSNMTLLFSVQSDGNDTYDESYRNNYLAGESVYGGVMDGNLHQLAMGIVDSGEQVSNEYKELSGFVFWSYATSEANVNAMRSGTRSGPMPPSWGGTVPEGLISGGWTPSDSISLYNQILSLYGSYADRYSNLFTINSLSFQRRTPITVFVSLDSPEAAVFIRTDPIMANLSPEERKKKLQDMLDASDEYVEKIFGEGFPGTGLDPAVGEAGDTPGVEIAGVGPYGPGHMPEPILPANQSPRGPYTPIKDYGTPGNPKFMPSGPSKNPWSARNKNKPMVASYEPKGQLISEKRKLKSPQEILKKIPGYYDGKPAPLGFPVEPPPKTINGYHPDLVDGKKVSDRFNRLDPISAKAMPLTGNPHIDKKVRAARKKPK